VASDCLACLNLSKIFKSSLLNDVKGLSLAKSPWNPLKSPGSAYFNHNHNNSVYKKLTNKYTKIFGIFN